MNALFAMAGAKYSFFCLMTITFVAKRKRCAPAFPRLDKFKIIAEKDLFMLLGTQHTIVHFLLIMTTIVRVTYT